MNFLSLIFGDPNAKKITHYTKILHKVRVLSLEYTQKYTDLEAVQNQTRLWRDWAPKIEGDIVDSRKVIADYLGSILPEAIALHVRACELIHGKVFTLQDGREFTWNMLPYDVQIIGALCLHEWNIAEMRTGEGKTFVASIAAYLNALSGLPVHIITVNDYLAARDAHEMRCIYEALGLTVGIVSSRWRTEDKIVEYKKSIVYVTNNEIGFDYLRDNMAQSTERQVAARRYFAIVDEVDSILVDEARTPLIISAPDTEPTKKYLSFSALAASLKETEHYKVDEKQKTATLTESGIAELEKLLQIENIYLGDHYNDIHHIENALKARTVYLKDKDYLIRNNEILIIDEHTGRVLPGRRYSDGLHQALEAKEGVEIQQESKTLASITFQNYFRLYPKLSGMTGTAKTEEEEFYKIYRLEVITIPTNKPILREDRSDLLFKNEQGKYAFAVKLIAALHEKGQPILVGTVSVAKSEYLSELLRVAGVPHDVLNAKQDAREADIIRAAGKFGSVTIATNMAGRGTDIKLEDASRDLSGEVVLSDSLWNNYTFQLGGLFVLGMEKHETRRIDNQLRGRSWRQGDPGTSQFLVSPEDDIMRIFWGEKLFGIFNSPLFASIPECDPLIQSNTLTKRITAIQKQVEGRNFDIRKHILEYDDVLNQHRLVLYRRRNKILENAEILENALQLIREDIASRLMWLKEQAIDGIYQIEAIEAALSPLHNATTHFQFHYQELMNCISDTECVDVSMKQIQAYLESLSTFLGEEKFQQVLRYIMLRSYDENWMIHIDRMSHLKEEVAFEGFAQKQPLVVYKERAYDRFIGLMQAVSLQVSHGIFSFIPGSVVPEFTSSIDEWTLVLEHETEHLLQDVQEILEHDTAQSSGGVRVIKTTPSPQYSAGRNESCPCGSWKKFKHCHGK